MNINRTLRLSPDQYYRDVVPKTQLYLHHTVGGSAVSTFKYWQSTAERVATAYIIERDGTVYEVFDPHYWAHHLGLKIPQNVQCNKQSIGIELASEGALRSGTELNNIAKGSGAPARFDPEYLYAFDIDRSRAAATEWFKNAKRLYHVANDGKKFWHLGTPWRSYSFFDRYDPPQLESLYELVEQLLKQFTTIMRRTPQQHMSGVNESVAVAFSGVLPHSMVRPDKSDLHCMFDWTQLCTRCELKV